MKIEDVSELSDFTKDDQVWIAWNELVMHSYTPKAASGYADKIREEMPWLAEEDLTKMVELARSHCVGKDAWGTSVHQTDRQKLVARTIKAFAMGKPHLSVIEIVEAVRGNMFNLAQAGADEFRWMMETDFRGERLIWLAACLEWERSRVGEIAGKYYTPPKED